MAPPPMMTTRAVAGKIGHVFGSLINGRGDHPDRHTGFGRIGLAQRKGSPRMRKAVAGGAG